MLALLGADQRRCVGQRLLGREKSERRRVVRRRAPARDGCTVEPMLGLHDQRLELRREVDAHPRVEDARGGRYRTLATDDQNDGVAGSAELACELVVPLGVGGGGGGKVVHELLGEVLCREGDAGEGQG